MLDSVIVAVNSMLECFVVVFDIAAVVCVVVLDQMIRTLKGVALLMLLVGKIVGECRNYFVAMADFPSQRHFELVPVLVAYLMSHVDSALLTATKQNRSKIQIDR